MDTPNSNTINITRLQAEMENVKKEIEEVKQEQKEGFEKVLSRFDSLDRIYVKKELYIKDIEEFQKDIEKRTSSKKWLWQTVGGVIIGISVGSIFDIVQTAILNNITP